MSERPAWSLGGALAFVVGGVQYLLLEAIAAAAWKSPPYSYASNYISDLGVLGGPASFESRVVNSPLAPVMNIAFVVEGGLFMLAAILLRGLLRGIWQPIFVCLAILHGIGIMLVGIFHASPDSPNSGPSLHTAGAILAILFGNLTVLLVGLQRGRLGVPGWFGALSLALPFVGLLSEVILLAGGGKNQIDGLLERGGSYSVVVWEMLFGMVGLIHSLRRPVRPRRSARHTAN